MRIGASLILGEYLIQIKFSFLYHKILYCVLKFFEIFKLLNPNLLFLGYLKLVKVDIVILQPLLEIFIHL